MISIIMDNFEFTSDVCLDDYSIEMNHTLSLIYFPSKQTDNCNYMHCRCNHPKMLYM